MSDLREVLFHFDFVSPYSWLALMEADAFARRHRVRFNLRPVVYAALLDASGLVGPVESPAKRRYTFLDVARSAARRGFRLAGPPEHPFRSLEALRTLVVFRERPQALALAARLADAAWGEGRALTDMAVLADVVQEVGLESEDLGQRIADDAVKRALRDGTADAVALGVFGVPTFCYEAELFWGHDRMEQLAERLAGAAAPDAVATARLLERPVGARRKLTPP